jgi:hypothetical protein
MPPNAHCVYEGHTVQTQADSNFSIVLCKDWGRFQYQKRSDNNQNTLLFSDYNDEADFQLITLRHEQDIRTTHCSA